MPPRHFRASRGKRQPRAPTRSRGIKVLRGKETKYIIKISSLVKSEYLGRNMPFDRLNPPNWRFSPPERDSRARYSHNGMCVRSARSRTHQLCSRSSGAIVLLSTGRPKIKIIKREKSARARGGIKGTKEKKREKKKSRAPTEIFNVPHVVAIRQKDTRVCARARAWHRFPWPTGRNSRPRNRGFRSSPPARGSRDSVSLT